jgi:hypothetical protein
MQQLLLLKINNQPADYWQRLKRLAGWSNEGRRINTSQVIDSKGQLVHLNNSQSFTLTQVWTKAFQYQPNNESLFSTQCQCQRQQQVQLFIQIQQLQLSDTEDISAQHNSTITAEEVVTAIQSASCHKASGLDNIPIEAFKWGGEAMVKALVELFNTVLQAERVPDDWNHALIKPLYKSGDDRALSARERAMVHHHHAAAAVTQDQQSTSRLLATSQEARRLVTVVHRLSQCSRTGQMATPRLL